jgi:hypothetical protein
MHRVNIWANRPPIRAVWLTSITRFFSFSEAFSSLYRSENAIDGNGLLIPGMIWLGNQSRCISFEAIGCNVG